MNPEDPTVRGTRNIEIISLLSKPLFGTVPFDYPTVFFALAGLHSTPSSAGSGFPGLQERQPKEIPTWPVFLRSRDSCLGGKPKGKPPILGGPLTGYTTKGRKQTNKQTRAVSLYCDSVSTRFLGMPVPCFFLSPSIGHGADGVLADEGKRLSCKRTGVNTKG